MNEDAIRLMMYAAIAVGSAIGILALSHFLGPKRALPHKFDSYECGVDPLETTTKRFHVKFYVVATLFILFDVETVFLVPWAVVFKTLGQTAILEMFLFIGILAAGLVYVLRRGALEWD